MSPWCPLPWSHIGVKNNGDLRMCSHSQSAGTGNTLLVDNGRTLTLDDLATGDVLNSETLKQVRRDFMRGEWPGQCRRCEVESAAGNSSRDQWETQQHAAILTRDQAFAMTAEDGTIDQPFLATYDIRLGNQCNLRCAPCHPGESHKWFDDYEAITGNDSFMVDGRTYGLRPVKGDFDWIKDEESVDALVARSANLQKITFGGGEPLLIKQHHSLVRKLVEAGYAPNIELEYSTNLTVFPKPLWSLWSAFKGIKLCASVDGVGEVNEAVRWPGKWDVVTANLAMLDQAPENISIFTSSTVHLLTIEHYADYMLWLIGQRFRKINAGMSVIGIAHPVYNPVHLNICLLDDQQRARIFGKLYATIDASSAKTSHKETMRKRVAFFETFAERNVQNDAATFRKRFCQVYAGFARQQGQDFATLFPEATRLVEEWA